MIIWLITWSAILVAIVLTWSHFHPKEFARPKRLYWDDCSATEYGITCIGRGDVDLHGNYIISANGEIIEVTITGVTWGGPDGDTWTAQDRASYEDSMRL